MPPRGDGSPYATARVPVRVFITGITCSRSISSVISLTKGYTRVTWPSTPDSSITGEPGSMPCNCPLPITTRRL